MISNKRFSYAPASSSSTPFHSDIVPSPINNGHLLHNPHHHGSTKQSLNFHPQQAPLDNSNLLYRKAKDRNSLSLNHEFSHMYINKNNPNNHLGKPNFSTSQNSKSYNRSLIGGAGNNNNNVDILPTLEEIQKHKRNALESKKQMSQMEKSISFWCDCTDYWRTKWKKTKDDKRKIMTELNSLRSQVSQLEKQLKVSEEKRSRLSEKYYKLCHDNKNNSNKSVLNNKKNMKAVQPNIDIDNSNNRKKQSLASTKVYNFGDENAEDEDDNDGDEYREYSKTYETNEIQIDNHVYGQIQSSHASSSMRAGSTKVVLRNHDRLLDKKITNRKRFSQVVMCDAEELLQMAEIDATNEQPSENTLQRNLPTNIPEEDPEMEEYDYGQEVSDNRGRGFHYEEAEIGEDEEDLSELNSSDLRNVSLKVRQHLLKGISSVSTLETNSECVNVGSINDDQSTAIGCDDDSTANEDDDDDDDEQINDNDNQNQAQSASVLNKDSGAKAQDRKKPYLRNDSRDGDADFEDDSDEDEEEDDEDDDDNNPLNDNIDNNEAKDNLNEAHKRNKKTPEVTQI